MKIKLNDTELLNLLIDLKVFLALCPNLNKDRIKRNKKLYNKLKRYYLKKEVVK